MIDNRSKTDRLIGLFLLGSVLFNYPILALFNLQILFLDIPLIYLYIFMTWTGFIVLIIIITNFRMKTHSVEPSADTDISDLFNPG